MRSHFLVFFLATGAVSAQGRVWRVAPGGGDFTEIQPAIDAAQSGDVILVASRTTDYRPFVSLGKALSLLASTAQRPRILGRSDAVGIPAGGTFLLAGLEIRAADYSGVPGIGDPYALAGSGSTGSTIALSNCKFETGRGDYRPSPPDLPSQALQLDVHNVVMQDVEAIGQSEAAGCVIVLRGDSQASILRCRFQGGNAASRPLGFCTGFVSDGGTGLGISAYPGASGATYIAETSCMGGDVPTGSLCPQRGGSGIATAGRARVFTFARSALVGGGQGVDINGSTGGHGFWSTDGQASLWIDGNPFRGGSVTGPRGTPGQPVFGVTVTPRKLSGLWFVPPLADRATNTVLTLVARPAEPHVLFLGTTLQTLGGAPVPEPVLLFGGPFTVLGGMLTDPTGRATLTLPVPNDPSLVGRAVHSQAFGLATSQLVVSPAATLTMR